MPPRAHFTGTKWLFVKSTVAVLLLHSKLCLGSEMKLFGLLNTINKRDSKALSLFFFFCYFPPYFLVFAFTSEMI